MKLLIEKYKEQTERLPKSGKHIIGQFDEQNIVVYQVYNHRIADFALKNKHLGGEGYSYTRMTWIKPNFLWMMFRAGWASKENQERILAITLPRIRFELILADAVATSFQSALYSSESAWKNAMADSDVRMQWDPDHNPFGQTIQRRAIQIGLKGRTAEHYANEWIVDIEDITGFVRQQKDELDNLGTQNLCVPKEEVYTLLNPDLSKSIGIESNF
jgi:hypothetical protein